jgi:hypothetical protein
MDAELVLDNFTRGVLSIITACRWNSIEVVCHSWDVLAMKGHCMLDAVCKSRVHSVHRILAGFEVVRPYLYP